MSSTSLELKVERAVKSEPAVQAQSATHKPSIMSPATGKERVKELGFPSAAPEACCTKDVGLEALIAGVELTHSVRRTAMMMGTLRRTQRLRQEPVLRL